MAEVAVIGLGSMGYGMAVSLLRSGHVVHGYDVNPAAVARFREEGGSDLDLAEVAPRLDAAVIVVLNAAQTDTVLFGPDGLAAQMAAGTVVLGCATVSPEFARSTESRCTETGLLYLDAPISGGSGKAAAGRLSVMAAGSAAAFEAAQSVLDATAETVFHLGDHAGPGSAMKAVNQMLAGVHIAAMAEAMTFGMTQGIPPALFMEVIPECAGTSWMLENRGPHIVAGDYRPHSSVNIWPKDLGIVRDIAGAAGFDAPITAAALAQFIKAAEAGLGGEDDAAVAKVYAKAAGLTLPGRK